MGAILPFWRPPAPSVLPHGVSAPSGLLGGFKPFVTQGVLMGAAELERETERQRQRQRERQRERENE